MRRDFIINLGVMLICSPSSLKQDEILDIKGKIQYSRKHSGAGIGPLWLEKEQGDNQVERTKVSSLLADRILYLSNYGTNEQVLSIDMFLYVPVRKKDSFWLVKGSEVLKFVPINDCISTWVHRLEQAAYGAQKAFLSKAPVEFFAQSKQFNHEICHTHARVSIQDTSTNYERLEVVLKLDYIYIYREGITVCANQTSAFCY